MASRSERREQAGSTCTSTTRPARCRSRTTRPRRPRPTARTTSTTPRSASSMLDQHSAGVLERVVRHRQQRRLPALLLELPRHREAGLRSRHPLHQRGVARLRDPPGGIVAAAAGSADREEVGLVVALDVTDRQAPARSTAWAATTTRTPWRSRATTSSSCSPATTRSPAARSPACFPAGAGARPVAALLVHRPQTPRRAGRQGRPVGVRVRHARLRRLLRLRARVEHGRHRPLHQGAEGHRDRAQGRRLPRSRPPTSATRAPPTNGSWQTDLRSVAPVGIDGPQWVLEYWSDINNVFQFVRVEDIAYDKRPRHGQRRLRRRLRPRHATGRPGSTRTSGPPTAGSGRWCSTSTNPTVVTSMTIFVEGDDNPVKTLDEVHQPDNIETTTTGILLTEDPGLAASSSRPARPTRTPPPARLWYVPFAGTPAGRAPRSTSPPTAARPTSTAAPPATGAPGRPPASSTPRRPSARGAFLINVQAHTLWVEKAPGDDNNGDGQPDFTYKREGGQLLADPHPGRVGSGHGRRRLQGACAGQARNGVVGQQVAVSSPGRSGGSPGTARPDRPRPSPLAGGPTSPARRTPADRSPARRS